jgi:hypothetical protein
MVTNICRSTVSLLILITLFGGILLCAANTNVSLLKSVLLKTLNETAAEVGR